MIIILACPRPTTIIKKGNLCRRRHRQSLYFSRFHIEQYYKGCVVVLGIGTVLSENFGPLLYVLNENNLRA